MTLPNPQGNQIMQNTRRESLLHVRSLEENGRNLQDWIIKRKSRKFSITDLELMVN
ncbi:hypothetical protein RchiOBHm_Chr3g0472551 [Rosa chinensis]|uniref:Uncharacterized protein n=1 Tax=Rosa chinensis TaxID=74649 RepID=A0A2P6RBL3_ROSCH|nr:hypothetical protein RchiOBHm_Chr3g0472551 [Rosa chinensis]